MILSELIVLPLVASLLVLCVPRRHDHLIKLLALAATGAVLLLAALMVVHFSGDNPRLQWIEHRPWIPALNAWYYLGVDGISMALVFLTALLGFICCIASCGAGEKTKGYFFLYLLLMSGIMGVFLAQDLLLFFVFWELVLIPIYFLLNIWGGPGREPAATKFFIYTLAGSVLMLLGIAGVYCSVSPHTLSIPVLAQVLPGLDSHTQFLLFLAFFLAFAVKLPAFPFHTWLPEAYIQAPTPVTVIMAGLLAKMGGYGMLRICFPFFTDAAHQMALPLAVGGVITIVYAAFIAVSQKDFKRMIAYASVSHMGFVLLGLSAINQAGFNGALLEMFNHGIIIAGLFLLAGILSDRSGTRLLVEFGGLWQQMPVFGFFLMLCGLATLGLPGLNGFVSEFLSLLGAFGRFPFLTAVAALGLIIAAAYILFMISHVLLGKIRPQATVFADLGRRELLMMTPLAVIIAIAGVCPMIVLRLQETAVAAMMRLF